MALVFPSHAVQKGKGIYKRRQLAMMNEQKGVNVDVLEVTTRL